MNPRYRALNIRNQSQIGRQTEQSNVEMSIDQEPYGYYQPHQHKVHSVHSISRDPVDKFKSSNGADHADPSESRKLKS